MCWGGMLLPTVYTSQHSLSLMGSPTINPNPPGVDPGRAILHEWVLKTRYKM